MSNNRWVRVTIEAFTLEPSEKYSSQEIDKTDIGKFAVHGCEAEKLIEFVALAIKPKIEIRPYREITPEELERMK